MSCSSAAKTMSAGEGSSLAVRVSSVPSNASVTRGVRYLSGYRLDIDGFDPRSCMPRPVSLFSKPRSSCSVPRSQVDDRNHSYRKVVFELKKEFTWLKVFDPLPYLCDASACYAMNGGHLFYSDDNHLSDAGAAYLSEKFFEGQSSQVESVVHSSGMH